MHRSDNSSRVNATREKCANRNVRHESRADTLKKRVIDGVNRSGIGRRRVRLGTLLVELRRAPPDAFFHDAFCQIHAKKMSREQFARLRVHRLWAWDIAKAHEVSQRLAID